MKSGVLPYFLSALALVALVFFSYGFAAATFKFFPFELLRDARSAARALVTLIELERPDARSANIYPVPFRHGGVTRRDPGRSSPGPTFVTLFRDDVFQALVLSPTGEVLHRWRIPFEAAGQLTNRSTGIALNARQKMIHGAYLYPNGDLVYSVERSGLAKIDKESRLIWTVPEATHHVVTIDADGTLWTLVESRTTTPDRAIPKIKLPYINDG